VTVNVSQNQRRMPGPAVYDYAATDKNPGERLIRGPGRHRKILRAAGRLPLCEITSAGNNVAACCYNAKMKKYWSMLILVCLGYFSNSSESMNGFSQGTNESVVRDWITQNCLTVRTVTANDS